MSEKDDNYDLRAMLTWVDSVACKWSNPKYVDRESTGPFEEGDARWNDGANCYDVYFKDKWWDRGAFIMGRVSAIEEQRKKESNTKMPDTKMPPKQKQVIEAVLEEAVQFPPKWEMENGSITLFVPMNFEGNHKLLKSIDVDFVTINKEGEIVRRFSITYKGTMQFDEVIKLLETQR